MKKPYVSLLVLLALMSGLFMAKLAPTPAAQAQSAPRTAFVHLFEWKWDDIAQECESYLGPKGFAAVQVSPPQEHVQGAQWWTRYQPVSYKIESRSGTRAQFASMVSRCKAVGVDIYVDAVINHMTGVGSGTGVAGSSFSPYVYPGIYQNQDFHHCGRNGNDDIANYQDRWEVQNCELVNLADLNTGSSYVRGKLAAYMNDLIGMGVAGFRIDAAKHMDTNELLALKGLLNGAPYIYQEVIDQGGEPIKASEYFQNGDVTEFKYSLQLGSAFFSGQLANLSQFGTSWGFMASDNAVVFTDNHDNQRGHGGGGHVLTYKDGALYTLGNVFELAWPYGYPQVMSSYEFSNGDQGPPSSRVHNNGAVNCFGEWKCEHRWREIGNMVGFRNATAANFFTSNWWSNGNNQIAFGRGDKGFVVINREGGALSRTFQTGLPAGAYCDVLSGELANGACTGATVTVNSAGQFTASVGAMGALAIHAGARPSGGQTPTPATPTATPTSQPGGVSVAFNVSASVASGQSVYVVGSIPALGSWSPGAAIPLAQSGAVWSKIVSLPASTAVEYKYIKKDGAGNVVWEGNANRAFTTPASGSAARNDTWGTLTSPTATPTPIPTATPTSLPGGSVAVAFTVNATTALGQNVYVVGNVAALGGWNTGAAVPLSSAGYPSWSKTISLPANTSIEYKYIKKDGAGTVIWESGANRVFTTPGSGSASRTDTWR
ncbi:MAG TPA: carbohydrate-binding module family 20 domain-containing protein [Herpetosiphonaceae bacterium]